MSLVKKTARTNWSAQNNPVHKNSGANNSNPNSNVNNNNKNNNNNNHKNSNKAEREKNTVYPHSEAYGKTNHSAEKCYFGANAANRPPPRHRRPQGQNQVPEKANQSDFKEVAKTAAS